MDVSQDTKTLTIKTKYFKLTYIKESDLLNPKDNYLKIQLINTDKEWNMNSKEVRNFFGSTVSLDDVSGKIPLLKG